jgi:hypothetical protein
MRRLAFWGLMIAAALLVLVTSCGLFFYVIALRPDEWEVLPKDVDPCKRFVPVPFREVASQQREAAIARLETRPAIEISREEARRLCGEAGPDGYNPYLVRGLSGNGSFHVLSDAEGQLRVGHVALGGRGRLRRSALIVWLPRAPSQVFVFAHCYE